MTKSEILRECSIRNIVKENNDLNKENLTYSEIVPITEISGNVSTYIIDLIDNKIDTILENNGYSVDYENLDTNNSNTYDGHTLTLPIKKINKNPEDELFNEIDEELNNNASNTPINQEPNTNKTQNIPFQKKTHKTQNPKKVDMILKNVFNSKFLKYKLATDAGKWKQTMRSEPNGKLLIQWENDEATNLKMETLLFPNDTNKIEVFVKDRSEKVLIKTFFEIYRIPTNEIVCEKFFRKTFLNLLKKFVDTKVILLEPFITQFIFWKSDNPAYSYSFSSPNKNKILLDLISFINTAQKPILDDFFEQNNLKHKQGYLQTLLDSAEAAGIFRFKREGNEIIILRGPNYKAFLDGKVRRVM